MKNICIIGFGYIGSKLVEFFGLRSGEYNITCITKTKTEIQKSYQNINFIIGRYECINSVLYEDFDIIILTAGQSSPKSCNNLLQTVYNDIVLFSYITELLNENQKLIYMSSGVVNCDTDDNYYNIVKKTINEITNVINSTNNKQIFGLCLGTVNGLSPIIRTDLMLNKMVYDAIKTNIINIYDKNCNRPILDINHLCNAVELIIKNGNCNNKGIYNICTYNETIENLAKYVKDNIPETNIIYKDKNENEYQYNFTMNSNEFIKNFGEFRLSVNDGNLIIDLKNCFTDKNEKRNTKNINKFKKQFEYIYNCRICNTITTQLLDLGNQPLANNYHEQNEILDTFPLKLEYCENCFHVQLNCVIDPDILFKDYIYTSGTSNTGKKYFKQFAETHYKPDQNKFKILDIACNDGSQLDAFKNIDENAITVGVDPAENLSIISKAKGHDIYCDYFNESVCNVLLEKYKTFDVIIAQNVFAHINNPNDFLKSCKKLLSPSGKLFIQTSQANMIINNEFDTAYHEHLSFFNTYSMKMLCSNQNMVLYNTNRVDIHGTSYLFEIHNGVGSGNTLGMLYYEMTKELYNIDTYKRYPLKCNIYKNEFTNILLKYKLDNYNIIGVGSAAKSNTLLNFCKIGNDIIDFIIDENKLKQNLLTPGSNILITDISVLQNLDTTKKYVIVIFGWNYYNEILNKILNIVNIDNFDIINVNPLETFRYIDKKLIK